MALHAFAATSAVPALSPESGAFCPACKKIRQNVKGFFRRTSFAPLPAARRDGAQPAAVGPRPVPRSQHSEFTQELQRFATRRVFPPAAARRDGAQPAAVGSRPVPRSQHAGFTQELQRSPHAVCSLTRCAPGRRAVRCHPTLSRRCRGENARRRNGSGSPPHTRRLARSSNPCPRRSRPECVRRW